MRAGTAGSGRDCEKREKEIVRIYLDYAATSPVKKEALDAMMPYLTSAFGNPSSIHEWGRTARGAVDEARESIAKFLGADPMEIIFTSGGTESDNLAIKGLVLPFIYQGKEKPHVITSMMEHHAVLRTCEYLEKNNLVEVTYIKPKADGIIDIQEVKKAIKENTVLVSIMYVNNEIGTVQPIREIGKMIEKINNERMQNVELNKNSKILNSELSNSRIYFHTDAVQAAEFQPMDVNYLHVDLLTISGHKIGAPKGIGVLYVKKGTPVIPMMHGGEQENGLRAGTENVAGIVALAKATELISQNENLKIKELRDYFIDCVLKEIPDTILNGSRELRSPNNVNFYFKYVEGESVLLNLDLVGIAASTGSACASISLKPSHVIMAMCNDAERAHGSIRFTLGEATTKKEIDYTIEKLKEIIKKLRAMSPLSRKDNELTK